MFRYVVAVALLLTAVLITGCGSQHTEPPVVVVPEDPTAPGDPGKPPTLTGLRFDFSGAVGLQLGPTVGQAGVTRAEAGSGLLKVLADGELADAVVEGSVRVLDFFVRNGLVFVLFEGHAEGCLFAAVDEHGEASCVDGTLSSIDIRSIQFDAAGGVYYRGTLPSGRVVIRRWVDGSTTDYYVANDAVWIERFVVTREGKVLVQGMSRGFLASESWIRVIEASGRTTQLEYVELLDFAPDGTLWVALNHGVGRFVVHEDEVRLEARLYCSSCWSSGARFAPGFACDSAMFHGDNVYRSSEAVIALTSGGLFRVFPTMDRLEVPVARLTNGVLRAGTAVIAGFDGFEPRAVVVDIRTGQVTDMLGHRRIDVLRLSLELDRERVLLYGIDLDVNRAVLGEYDLRTGSLNVAFVDAELASSFTVLDWRVSDVPPPVRAPPEVAFELTFERFSGFHEGTFWFEMSVEAGAPWIDALSWDFGDGMKLDGDHRVGAPSHRFTQPGAYEVALTAYNFLVTPVTRTLVVDVPDPVAISKVSHGLALDQRGRVWEGRLADNWTDHSSDLRPVSVEEGVTFEDVCKAGGGTVALDQTGTPWTWGTGWASRPTEDDAPNPYIPGRLDMPEGVSFSRLSCGDDFVLALDNAGRIWGWGRADSGQLGNGELEPTTTPVPSAAPDEITFVSIAAGSEHAVALDTEGRAWTWGSGASHALGTGTTSNALVPTAVPMPAHITFTTVTAHSGYTLALDQDGHAWGWGTAGSGQFGQGLQEEVRTTPAVIAVPSTVRFATITAGGSRVAAIDHDGRPWVWGQVNGFWRPPREVPMTPGITLVAASEEAFFLDERGGLFIYGCGGLRLHGSLDTRPSYVQPRWCVASGTWVPDWPGW